MVLREFAKDLRRARLTDSQESDRFFPPDVGVRVEIGVDQLGMTIDRGSSGLADAITEHVPRLSGESVGPTPIEQSFDSANFREPIERVRRVSNG